jgi:histidine triad (HIT) family protein
MADCLFCAIIEGKINGEIVYQDDAVLAFKDIRPEAPVHVLIVPRKHIESLSSLGADDVPTIGAIFVAAKKLAKELGIAESGYRVVVNNGADAGQSVFHLHYHLLGGRRLRWPPG